MFDSKQTLTDRLANAIDLVIDFATLGEYGIEPADRPAPSCQARHRSHPVSTARQPADRTLALRR